MKYFELLKRLSKEYVDLKVENARLVAELNRYKEKSKLDRYFLVFGVEKPALSFNFVLSKILKRKEHMMFDSTLKRNVSVPMTKDSIKKLKKSLRNGRIFVIIVERSGIQIMSEESFKENF